MISEQESRALAEGIKEYIRSRKDKKHEEYLKSKPQVKKGIVSKGINIRLAKIVLEITRDRKSVKSIEQSKKTKGLTSLAFQLDKYDRFLALLNPEHISNELSDIKQEYAQFLSELEEQYRPVNWLDEWTPQAKDISFATHVAKLTHSSSKGSSILDSTTDVDQRYLTTNMLDNPEIDTAAANAKSLPIADILKIEHSGVSVLDCVKVGDCSVFSLLTQDEEQILQWMSYLKQAYDSVKKRSYFLSKQVYFPLKEGGYHLLLPLTSSSLSQCLHDEHRKYFEDEQTQARAQRKTRKYCETPVIGYPGKAKLNITASNHSNASSLNGKRGGKITLFCSQPPSWQSKENYRGLDESKFFKQIGYRAKNEIQDLNRYLLLLNSKQLSDNQPERASAITRKVLAIADVMFDYIALAKSNEADGWTVESDLSLSYQLLFEPNREDTEAKTERASGEWLPVISRDFGRWLNKQLDKKKLSLTPIHSELWMNLLTPELRQFIATQEVSL